MSRTTTVSLKGRRGTQDDPEYGNVVYVGRSLHRGGWRLDAHPLANPHPVRRPCKLCGGQIHDHHTAVAAYAAHLLRRPDLLELIPPLRGKALGCFCVRADAVPCHADVIAALADWDQNEVDEYTFGLLTQDSDRLLADTLDIELDEARRLTWADLLEIAKTKDSDG